VYLNRFSGNVLSAKFEKVFLKNLWKGTTSRSGTGSSIESTAHLIKELPKVFSLLNIESILDVPCGDLEWMPQVNLSQTKYIGADISPSLIEHLKVKFPEREFMVLDITKELIPRVDLIFSRDLFVHLSNKDIRQALEIIKASGSTYLASTTFTKLPKNENLRFITREIAWRRINLQTKPYNFPKPEFILDEKCTEGNGLYADKSIGFWKIEHLP